MRFRNLLVRSPGTGGPPRVVRVVGDSPLPFSEDFIDILFFFHDLDHVFVDGMLFLEFFLLLMDEFLKLFLGYKVVDSDIAV